MKQLSVEQKVELVDKYFPGILEMFLKQSSKKGYFIDPNQVEPFKIMDEVLCSAQESKFLDIVIESIEDSVSMEEYGFQSDSEE